MNEQISGTITFTINTNRTGENVTIRHDSNIIEQIEQIEPILESDTESDTDSFISHSDGLILKTNLLNITAKISEYKMITKNDEINDDFCSICYDPFIIYENICDKVISLPCNHQYHKKCINQWNKVNKLFECPMCKKTYSDNNNINFETSLNAFSQALVDEKFYDKKIFLNCSFDFEINNYECDFCNKDINFYDTSYHRKIDDSDLCKECFSKKLPPASSVVGLQSPASSVVGLQSHNNSFVKREIKILEKPISINMEAYSIDKLKLNNCILENSNFNSENINMSDCVATNLLFNNVQSLTIQYGLINSLYFQNCNLISLDFDEVEFNTIDTLNNIMSVLSNSIQKISINYCRFISPFSETHKPIFKFNASQYDKLECLDISFDTTIFAKGSFNMSNHNSLFALILNNLIIDDLFVQSDCITYLNLPKSIEKITITNCQKKKFLKDKNTNVILDMGKFSDLKRLWLQYIKIDQIINLSDILEEVTLLNLKLKSISNIPINAKTIHLSNNLLTQLPAFNTCANLYEILVSNNKISEISIVNDNVERIYFNNNELKIWPNLETANLEKIYLNNNKIKKVPPSINELLKLTTLEIANNKLMEINIDANSKIRSLNISKNKITNITSLPKKISNLYAQKNRLTEINLKRLGIQNLSKINVSYNKLTELNVNKNHFIEEIICSHNLIKLFNFDIYNELNILKCDNNKIDELNLRVNVNKLIIHNNQLKLIRLKCVPEIKISKKFKCDNGLQNKIIKSSYFNVVSHIVYNVCSNVE